MSEQAMSLSEAELNGFRVELAAGKKVYVPAARVLATIDQLRARLAQYEKSAAVSFLEDEGPDAPLPMPKAQPQAEIRLTPELVVKAAKWAHQTAFVLFYDNKAGFTDSQSVFENEKARLALDSESASPAVGVLMKSDQGKAYCSTILARYLVAKAKEQGFKHLEYRPETGKTGFTSQTVCGVGVTWRYVHLHDPERAEEVREKVQSALTSGTGITGLSDV